jgi:hypothetical protein
MVEMMFYSEADKRKLGVMNQDSLELVFENKSVRKMFNVLVS